MKAQELDLKEDSEGVTVATHVQPKSSAEKIVGQHNGRLKVAVRAAPEKGKANHAVVKLLSRELGVPRRNIEIVRGDSSRDKLIRITGIGKEAILSLISTEK